MSSNVSNDSGGSSSSSSSPSLPLQPPRSPHGEVAVALSALVMGVVTVWKVSHLIEVRAFDPAWVGPAILACAALPADVGFRLAKKLLTK